METSVNGAWRKEAQNQNQTQKTEYDISCNMTSFAKVCEIVE
jgi:hypothetical protein